MMPPRIPDSKLLSRSPSPRYPTRVAGVLTTADGLREFSRQPDPSACDLVEIRLGEIPPETPAWAEQAGWIEAAGIPVLLTLRNRSEGGVWQDEDPGRWNIFQEALTRFSGVDVEWESRLRPAVLDAAASRDCTVVTSFHDFTRTPPRSELEDLLGSMMEAGARQTVIPKIACRIQQPEDVETLLDLLGQQSRPVCLIGMDALHGAETRLALARAGTCISYGYLDAPSAPGQNSSRELIARLNG